MLLAIDTATQILSIALHDGKSLLAECTLQAGRQQNTELARLIQRTMAQVDLRASDLRALAVSVGPGSYTGLRIGVALAKGMAAVQQLPLVPVTTLETVAEQCACHLAQLEQQERPLIVTVSAGRQRVIWAEYAWVEGSWRERRAAQISSWQELLSAYERPLVLSGEITAAGWGAIKLRREVGWRISVLPAAQRLRRAGYLAEIAQRRLRQNDGADAFTADRVMPLYLKGPG